MPKKLTTIPNESKVFALNDQMIITNTFRFGVYTVLVLYWEYVGGGTAYEFRIIRGDTVLHESDDGYGRPAGAAAGAFHWLAENGE